MKWKYYIIIGIIVVCLALLLLFGGMEKMKSKLEGFGNVAVNSKYDLDVDGVFKSLDYNQAGITKGESIFILNNPLLTEFGSLSFDFDKRLGSAIDRYEVYINYSEEYIDTERVFNTIFEECPTKGENISQNRDCSYEDLTINYVTKNKEGWQLINDSYLIPSGTHKIRLIAHWKAHLGEQSIDWIPAITVPKSVIGTDDDLIIKQDKWAWWNVSFNFRRNLTINESYYNTNLGTTPFIINFTNLNMTNFSNFAVVRNDVDQLPCELVNYTGSKAEIWCGNLTSMSLGSLNNNLSFYYTQNGTPSNYNVKELWQSNFTRTRDFVLHLNDNNTAHKNVSDSSGYNNNFSINNLTMLQTNNCVYGNCFNISATAIGRSLGFNITETISNAIYQNATLSFWIYTGLPANGDVTAFNGMNIGSRGIQGVTTKWLIQHQQITGDNGWNNWSFVINDVTNNSKYRISYSNWNYIVMRWNASSTELWVNGTKVAIINDNGVDTGGTGGDYFPDYHTTSGQFNLSYDEIRFQGTYMTDLEINQTYQMGLKNWARLSETEDTVIPSLPISFVSPTPSNGTTQSANSIYVNVTSNSSLGNHYTFLDFDKSLRLWMRMDDVNSTGEPSDLSSYRNNGSRNYNTVINSTGRFGNAIQFNSTSNQSVTLRSPVVPSLNNNTNFTISIWAYPRKQINSPFLIGNMFFSGDIGTSTRFFTNLHITNSDQVEFRGCKEGIGCTNTPSYSITLNNWYHFVAVYNHGNMTLYVNGTNVANTNYAFSGETTSTVKPSLIGAYDNGGTDVSTFNGTIDEVMFFDRVLNTSEILSLYNATANQYYNNFTNLTGNQHNFTAYMVDINGNKNQTEQRTINIGTLSGCPDGSIQTNASTHCATNFTNNASVGTIAWTNLDNAKLDDDSFATVSLLITQQSNYLKASNFTWDIPASAVVNGIQVQVARDSDTLSAITDASVRLMLNNGTVSVDRSNTSTWATTEQVVTYGSSSDTWGLVLNGTIVNHTNFSFVMSVSGGATGLAQVDSINMTMFYTVPSVNTCTYSSGNWLVNCWDNCSITTNVNLNRNNLTVNGSGTFTLNSGNITNIDRYYNNNMCHLIKKNGGGIKK